MAIMKVIIKPVLRAKQQFESDLKAMFQNVFGGQFGRFAKGVSTGMFGAGVGRPPAGLAFGAGKMMGKLAIIAGSVMIIQEFVKKIAGRLAEASPYLAGILDIFKKSFNNILRPFGDFLAQLLRPLAIRLLKWSVDWIKFWRKFELPTWEELQEDIIDALESFFTGAVDFGAWLAENIIDFFTTDLFNFAKWIGGKIYDFFAKDLFSFAKWILDNIVEFFTKDIFDFADWIGKHISDFISSVTKFDLIGWAVAQIKAALGFGGEGGGGGRGRNIMSIGVARRYYLGDMTPEEYAREIYLGSRRTGGD